MSEFTIPVSDLYGGAQEALRVAKTIASEIEAMEREFGVPDKPLPAKLPITGRVRVADLVVDHSYQRAVSIHRVARMVTTFDPTIVGVITVNMRKDGTLVVIDGQHRVAAMHELDPELHVDALIYDALEPAEEARIYWESQKHRRPLTPYDQFKARLVAGDEEALGIQEVLDRLGLTIIAQNEMMRERQVRSVAALQDMWKVLGPEGMETVLRVLMTVWPDEPDMMRDNHLRSLQLLFNKFGNHVNVDRLIERLAGVTPIQLRRMASSHQLLDGKGGSDRAYARAIAELYNGRLRADQRLRWE